jgi:hypothetical protein
MMDIDVSDILEDMAQETITIITATTTTVDFEPTTTTATPTPTALAIVQPADKNKLNPDTIDWSLEYILVHTIEDLSPGQFIQWSGKTFKVISTSGFNPYGYTEFVGEEVRGSIR